MSSILNYAGADPEQFLYKEAQTEPPISYYADTPIYQSLVSGFEKQYPGLKVTSTFLPGTLSARVDSEYKVGKIGFDVLDTSPNTVPRDAKLFAKFTADGESNVAADLKSDYEVAYTGFGISVTYSPAKISAADVPTSVAQLADAKYQGKICMGDAYTEQEWLGNVERVFGLATVKAIAKNVRVLNTNARAIADLVISGECPIQLGGISAHAALGSATQIRWLPLDPIIGEPRMVSISKDTKSPATSALFIDWLLSANGGQVINKAHGYGSPFTGQPIVYLNYLTDLGSRTIVYSTSKVFLGSYSTYPDALAAWAKLEQSDFIAK